MLHENARANGELLRPPYSTATVRRAPYGVVAATGDEEEESELVVEALTRHLLEIRGGLGLWDVRWVVISLLDDWTRPALEDK
jgi:hypothetical protein